MLTVARGFGPTLLSYYCRFVAKASIFFGVRSRLRPTVFRRIVEGVVIEPPVITLFVVDPPKGLRMGIVYQGITPVHAFEGQALDDTVLHDGAEGVLLDVEKPAKLSLGLLTERDNLNAAPKLVHVALQALELRRVLLDQLNQRV